jgi:hypothetical protein
MKINLIGMILNNCGRRCFDGAIIDDSGQKLDAAHSLDYMILEYAKFRLGGESSTVTLSREVTNTDRYPLPRCNQCGGLLHSGQCKPHNAK